MIIKRDYFEELFVLEMANNHLGNLDRALKIVADFSKVVRFNNVRATIKLQLRDVENFIHSDFRDRKEIRYIKKTLDTKMSREHVATIIEEIRQSGCIPSATPFDEASVGFCEELELPLIKIASSDINDWFLIERIAKTRKPVIASSGGSSLKDTDDLVTFFANRNIPLALNHCVSLYPAEDTDLQMNQIDFLKNRYPHNTIGFSTHEYHDWETSMAIAYAKGARTFERHIDIETEGVTVSPYCSLPHQVDLWFKSFRRVKAMCGHPGTVKRTPPPEELKYLDALVRGAYAKKDLQKGHVLTEEDLYLAIPLQKGQASCREIMKGQSLLSDIKKDAPLIIDQIDSPYAYDDELKQQIYNRGI
ncbi:MAG: N-acetylneuraminate synthase family protein [Verrucomicrobiae bacterium]|nr:N-acetylneuraminate synthase family protein [Verrucomicrobiae bacterium]